MNILENGLDIAQVSCTHSEPVNDGLQVVDLEQYRIQEFVSLQVIPRHALEHSFPTRRSNRKLKPHHCQVLHCHLHRFLCLFLCEVI